MSTASTGHDRALLPLTFAPSTPEYSPAVQIPLDMVVFTVAAAAILRRRRALPPDLDLGWVAPDATVLFVASERDRLRRARLDLVVDGRRVGQLPPGTAMLVPVQPGLRSVQVFLDRLRTAVSDRVNAVPGGASHSVRNRDSRPVELEFRRVLGGGRPVLRRHMHWVRVHPH